MHTIALLYENDTESGNDGFPRAARDILSRALKNGSPSILGHGSVLLPHNGHMHRYAFGPQNYPNTIPETRKNAQFIEPLYNQALPPTKFLRLAQKRVGEIFDSREQGPSPAASLHIEISEHELSLVEKYIRRIKAAPTTYRSGDSNCLTFLSNIAKIAGIDLSEHAHGLRVDFPDGLLVSFCALACTLKQTGDMEYAGRIDRKNVTISFHDKTLPEKVHRKFKTPIPTQACARR